MSAEPGAVSSSSELRPLRRAAEELAAKLPGLLVDADRVAATVVPGLHGRRRVGSGETFWQYRNYQQGDNARDIDWRASARSRHLFIREQEWEAAESVWLWCDVSASMRFNSAPGLPTKLDRAVILTLALASLLIRGGERVALLGSGQRPLPGRHGIERLADGLPRLLAKAGPPEADLPRLARVVLISDFLEPADSLVRMMAPWVGAGARGCMLEVLDPAEEALPYEGRVLFEGLEQEGRVLIGNVGRERDRYRELLGAHRDEVRHLASRQGWRLARHRTDRSAESGLLTLYQLLAPGVPR